MKKNTLLLTSAFCAFIIALPAFASDRGPFAETPDLRSQMRDSAFSARDINEDKIIDKTEVRKAIDTTFKLMDRNGDSNISSQELKRYERDYKRDFNTLFGTESNTFITRREKSVNTMDDDDDGAISRKEFYKYYEARYGRMDNNLDSFIDRNEFRLDYEKASTYEIDTTP